MKNHKVIFENRNGKIIRAENDFGAFVYMLCDKDGKFVREFSSVYRPDFLPEIFPNLSK